MVMVSEQFHSFVDFDPVLRDVFFSSYERELGGGGALSVFRSLQSVKSKETDQRVGGFADPVPFDGTIEYGDVERGYEVEYTFPELASGFQVTRKMRDDLQYQTIFDNADGMATAYARKRRKDAASVFNNAFSASYLGYDGKALCANDHPRSRTDSTAVDNLATLALTAANLETVVVQHQSLKDDLGEEIVIMPDTLIVPRALRKDALEIVGSQLDPASANNAINIQAGVWRVVVDPYLTDANAWFIVDSAMANRYLKWYDRITPEFTGTQDFDTMIWKYRGYMRYGYGWSDFRWICGSNPS
jgi:hypothetical protein